MLDPIVSDCLNLLNDSLTEAWEERAAILEYEANYSRELSEALALLLIIRQFPADILNAMVSEEMRK